MDLSPLPSFATAADLRDLLEQLAGKRCPKCHHAGALVGHGWLRGYAADGTPAQVRGRRLLCSARGRKAGCGRTASVLLASVLRGFSGTTTLLTAVLAALSEGHSVRHWFRTAAQRPALTLRSVHRIVARVRRHLSAWRVRLSRHSPSPSTSHHDPVAAITRHLRLAFPTAHDPVAALQRASQRGLFAPG